VEYRNISINHAGNLMN